MRKGFTPTFRVTIGGALTAMANLKRAHEELFRREPDELFPDLPALIDHCRPRQGAVERPLAAPPDARAVCRGRGRSGSRSGRTAPS